MRKIAALVLVALMGVCQPASALDEPTPVTETKLVSAYPCYARYSPVTVFVRTQNDDGTWSDWHYQQTLDRWQNPNYPCAGLRVLKRKHPRFVTWVYQYLNPNGQWVTYRKERHMRHHHCH